jgi:ribosomal protein S27E
MCPGTRCTNQVEGNGLCIDCENYFGVMLAALPPLFSRARSMLDKAGRVGEERITVSSTGSRPPLHVGILDTTDAVIGLIAGWVATIRIAQHEPLLPGGDDAPWLRRACMYLIRTQRHLDNHLLIRVYADVYRVHRDLTLIAGDTPESERLTTPCPTCGNVSIIRRRADDYARCLTCGGRWGQAAYRGIRPPRHDP